MLTPLAVGVATAAGAVAAVDIVDAADMILRTVADGVAEVELRLAAEAAFFV